MLAGLTNTGRPKSSMMVSRTGARSVSLAWGSSTVTARQRVWAIPAWASMVLAAVLSMHSAEASTPAPA